MLHADLMTQDHEWIVAMQLEAFLLPSSSSQRISHTRAATSKEKSECIKAQFQPSLLVQAWHDSWSAAITW